MLTMTETELPSYLCGVPFALLVGSQYDVFPLVIAQATFTTILIAVLFLVTCSRIFVISVFLPSLVAAYAGNPWLCFWLGQIVCHTWMNGLWGIPYVVSQYCLLVSLIAICWFPGNHVETWTSILRHLNVDLDFMTSCLHAYYVDIHPAIQLLSGSMCRVVDKMVYTTDQFVKHVVFPFNQTYRWCPDKKRAEYARLRAELAAKRSKQRPSRDAARQQREDAQRRFPSGQRMPDPWAKDPAVERYERKLEAISDAS